MRFSFSCAATRGSRRSPQSGETHSRSGGICCIVARMRSRMTATVSTSALVVVTQPALTFDPAKSS